LTDCVLIDAYNTLNLVDLVICYSYDNQLSVRQPTHCSHISGSVQWHNRKTHHNVRQYAPGLIILKGVSYLPG